MENVIENSVHLHGQNQPTVHVDGLPGGYGYEVPIKLIYGWIGKVYIYSGALRRLVQNMESWLI